MNIKFTYVCSACGRKSDTPSLCSVCYPQHNPVVERVKIPADDYQRMRDEIEQLREERKRAAADWCSDDDDIRKQALRVLPESVVNGDSYYVPRFGALAELLANEIEQLRTTNAQQLAALRLCGEYLLNMEADGGPAELFKSAYFAIEECIK